jgi:hypothetical protein
VRVDAQPAAPDVGDDAAHHLAHRLRLRRHLTGAALVDPSAGEEPVETFGSQFPVPGFRCAAA